MVLGKTGQVIGLGTHPDKLLLFVNKTFIGVNPSYILYIYTTDR